MSSHARTILRPGASRKRKERETHNGATLQKPFVKQTAVSGSTSATTSSKGVAPQPKPLSSNRLLAGYMAHEFLTKGTLFGEKFDQARAEGAQASTKSKQVESRNQPSTEAEPIGKFKLTTYAEVANLLKSDGAHVPGVVNPTQLARWIQM